MADRKEIEVRLAFRKEALTKMRAAYLALIDGGVKSYTIDDRSLTKFDIPELYRNIKEAENEIDEMESVLRGGRRRKAFGIVPREW